MVECSRNCVHLNKDVQTWDSVCIKTRNLLHSVYISISLEFHAIHSHFIVSGYSTFEIFGSTGEHGTVPHFVKFLLLKVTATSPSYQMTIYEQPEPYTNFAVRYMITISYQLYKSMYCILGNGDIFNPIFNCLLLHSKPQQHKISLIQIMN